MEKERWGRGRERERAPIASSSESKFIWKQSVCRGIYNTAVLWQVGLNSMPSLEDEENLCDNTWNHPDIDWSDVTASHQRLGHSKERSPYRSGEKPSTAETGTSEPSARLTQRLLARAPISDTRLLNLGK